MVKIKVVATTAYLDVDSLQRLFFLQGRDRAGP